MKIAVIEIMETGHVTLAESVCRIFGSDPDTDITLFTLPGHAESLGFITKTLKNIRIIAKKPEQSFSDFLNSVGQVKFDRIYIITLTKRFKEFSNWKPQGRIFLVVHNLEEWFGLTFFKALPAFFDDFASRPRTGYLLYLLKLHFIYPVYKRRILRKTVLSSGSLVVLSEAVKKEALKLSDILPVEVLPFSVFDPEAIPESGTNGGPLKICIPGLVSQYRRDYLGLMDLIGKRFGDKKEMFTIDFLGGIRKDNHRNDTAPVLEMAHRLSNIGFAIIIHETEFIAVEEYDRQLSGCDIILGNMNVRLSARSRYGQTKETGLPFAMIKAAKPGILPSQYEVPSELETSVVRYNNYDELGDLIEELINDRQRLKFLSARASENSLLFTPDKIYDRIKND